MAVRVDLLLPPCTGDPDTADHSSREAFMTAHRLVAAGGALLAASILTACSGSSNDPEVPSLGSASAQPTATGNRVAALHAAAQCIREHGVPTYQDPVLNAEGQVFTDTRSLQRYADGGKAISGGKAGKGGKST